MTIPPEAQGFVCLGASAGGLRSIEAVLRRLGPSLPWPVLVAQHMQADHPSQLPEILARATTLPVHEAADGELPQAGHVYVCPSSSELGVSPEGRLVLRPPAPGRPQRVDHMFSTASCARPGLVVAVVLSGTGTDGAGGALVVKLNGGTVLAESESTALHSGMPNAARQSGAVDSVHAADEMGPLIAGLAGGSLRELGETVERVLRRIAATLASHAGTPFDGYRTATIRRRVEKRRVLSGSPTLQSYADLVAEDGDERDALIKSLLIPVTEFFRDPAAWQGLAADVLPEIIERANEGERVHVWCAGCATGEEAFTLAMLVAERVRDPSVVEIVGTDLSAEALRHARRGVYAASRLREVTPERLERFFVKDGDEHRVGDALRSLVRFEAQDVTRETPPGQFDLIVCRNVLIYFDEALQAEVLGRFRRALRPDGTLFLGLSEAFPRHHGMVASIGSRLRLFQATIAPPVEASATARDVDARSMGVSDVSAALLADSDALLLVMDASWRVTSVNERAEAVLGRGIVGASLLDAIPDWQGSPVEDALRSSLTTGRSVRVFRAPAPQGPLDVTIEPFPRGAHTLLLVAHATPVRPPSPHKGPRADLAADLAAANEELQATNEELAAANEELQASNEELQATNEELASLNEEFQSTNENLASTNAELRAGADAAQEKFLRAALMGRQEALVLCDRERHVVLYNPAARTLLGLTAADVGRALDLSLLGVAAQILREWFDACEPAGSRVERASERLRVRVEALETEDGGTGWLVACTPLAPAG